jgi:hypothetical protein
MKFMRPFIFNFKETPSIENLDLTLIEYSDTLNLNVDIISNLPAIEQLSLATETFTKEFGEASDSDRNNLNLGLVTQTHTFAQSEGSDEDEGGTNAIFSLVYNT